MGPVLVPVHLSGYKRDHAHVPAGVQVPERERDAMDDLVDQLAALDSQSQILYAETAY